MGSIQNDPYLQKVFDPLFETLKHYGFYPEEWIVKKNWDIFNASGMCDWLFSRIYTNLYQKKNYLELYQMCRYLKAFV